MLSGLVGCYEMATHSVPCSMRLGSVCCLYDSSVLPIAKNCDAKLSGSNVEGDASLSIEWCLVSPKEASV